MKKLDWKTCFRIGVTVFVLFLAVHYWDSAFYLLSLVIGAAAPLLTGCVIAYLLNILMSFYEKHYFPKKKSKWVSKSRRITCLIAACATLLGIVILIFRLVIPELIACIQLLTAEIPKVLEICSDYIAKNGAIISYLPEDFSKSLTNINWQEKISQMVQFLSQGFTGAAKAAASVLSVVFSGVVNLVVGIIFSIYLLFGKERLAGQTEKFLSRYLKKSWNQKLHYVVGTLNDSFHRFIVGQCLEAVILGVLCTIGMLIFRFPYAGMIGALIGFTALIPIAGAYIGAGVGALMILTVSPEKALLFLIFIVVLQQVEGNLIYPKVVGASIGLPGIWVLAAVTIGGGISGVFGMLLGVPITAAIYQMLRRDINTPKKQPK